MKFLKLNSKLTQDQIEKIMDSFTKEESRDIRFLYMGLPHVNFIDEDGIVGMYVVVNNLDLDEDFKTSFDKLVEIYKDKGIDFSVQNVSDLILSGKSDLIDIDYKTVYGDIGVTTIEDEMIEMMDDFYKSNVTIDHILDKMNESGKGMKAVSEFDMTILKRGY